MSIFLGVIFVGALFFFSFAREAFLFSFLHLLSMEHHACVTHEIANFTLALIRRLSGLVDATVHEERVQAGAGLLLNGVIDFLQAIIRFGQCPAGSGGCAKRRLSPPILHKGTVGKQTIGFFAESLPLSALGGIDGRERRQ